MAYKVTDFRPRFGLANPHAQTVSGNFWRRPKFILPPEIEQVLVDPADGSRVLCHCNWQRDASGKPIQDRLAVILVHGLEGSSDSRYIHGVAARLWKSGMHIVRMNQRNCGGSDALTPTLYNSALSNDVGAVIDWVAAKSAVNRIALVGFSMGGNLVLKHAGERGDRKPLVAVAAVSPAINLSASSTALNTGLNRAYEWWFLRGLMARYRRKAALFPSIYAADPGPINSLRDFDNKIVARYFNYADAEDYYTRAAAANVVSDIKVPTLYLHSNDDPFIKLLPNTQAAIEANPAIQFHLTNRGGHCAFLGNTVGEDVHWAEMTVANWLKGF